MRFILTKLCALLLLASLLGMVGLVFQHLQQNKGQMSQLPTVNLTPRPSNLYGVNIELLAATTDTQTSTLHIASTAGFGWVRQTFQWQEDSFDWETADKLVAAVTHNNLGMIAVLSGKTAPNDPSAFAKFAGRFASRYGDNIDVYQIWDEPNLLSSWGETPSAAAYGQLLAASHTAIHQSDSHSTVLLAGLAPTIETGPDNISDLIFLRQLYETGAGPFFDAAAGKPYGFSSTPEDRRLHPRILNFSRFILLRAEMERAGDTHKLLWGTNFGWYNPKVASNPKNTWGVTDASQQSKRTVDAFERARVEWPWSGVLVLDNLQPSDNLNDPRWGFSMLTPEGQPLPILDDLRHRLKNPDNTFAPPGIHSPTTPFALYKGDWQFSGLGADIPQFGKAEISFAFEGTDLGIIARRGDYRATLFVKVDGEPANQLPTNVNGEAYQILTSPDLSSRIDLLPIAGGLSPGKHIATIRAERGWEQWAIAGFSVLNAPDRATLTRNLSLLITAALILLVMLIIAARGRSFSLRDSLLAIGNHQGSVLTALGLAALFWLSASMAWGQSIPHIFRRQSDALPLALTAFSAGLFYLSPWLLLTLASLITLFVLFYARPAIGLALIALAAPFYLQPRPMFERVFSAVEIFTLLLGAAVAMRWISHQRIRVIRATGIGFSLNSLDLAVLLFGFLATASIISADLRGVAFNELRTMVLEPILFYGILRSLPLKKKELWRIVDFFIIGASLVAVIGLVQYALGVNLITAEGGVLRLRSVYGSPNNVGLYLGRALPVAVAVALLGGSFYRRLSYLGAVILMAAALALSFSRGALLLGVPAALTLILLFRGGKTAAAALIALLTGTTSVLFAFGNHPRLISMLSYTTGPTFFRLNLWRSTLKMIKDNPFTGIGLDNFLYAYRGKYIAPEAWQDPHLSHAHYWILDFAARIGLPGLGAMLWILVAFFNTTARALRILSDPGLRALTIGLMASMVDFLAHGMVDASYWFVDLAFAFMLTIALAQHLVKSSRETTI